MLRKLEQEYKERGFEINFDKTQLRVIGKEDVDLFKQNQTPWHTKLHNTSASQNDKICNESITTILEENAASSDWIMLQTDTRMTWIGTI